MSAQEMTETKTETETETTTWTGPVNEEGNPTGKGELRLDGKIIYSGNIENGTFHDKKAWALMGNISDEFTGYVGFVGEFVRGLPYGPCNIYPEVNNPDSKIEGMMIAGKFVRPAFKGSKMYFADVNHI